MLATKVLLPEGGPNLSAYLATGGYDALRSARRDTAALRARLGACTLTGLGGAHFPFARKLQLALASPGPRVVVCNAAEDEPGSSKDRTLLERNPHLVIEGALVAAVALDANHIYVYIGQSSEEALGAVEAALAELPPIIVGDSIEIGIVRAPAAYVAGEATAAIRAIEGAPARPTTQPPYPTESGVSGCPTLVSNCETLANLPRLLTDGEFGDAAQRSRLATITGDVAIPGVLEIQPGATTFADVIARAGGLCGPRPTLKALQPGGPSSAYLPAAAIDVRLTDTEIVAAGSHPGCLAIRVLSEARCVVEELEEITGFFAREQCGQCPACRMKTQAYARTMQKIRQGRGDWKLLEQLDAVEDFVLDLPRRCALISMPTLPVASGLRLFRSDFAGHIDLKTCHGEALSGCCTE